MDGETHEAKEGSVTGSWRDMYWVDGPDGRRPNTDLHALQDALNASPRESDKVRAQIIGIAIESAARIEAKEKNKSLRTEQD